MTLAGLPVGPHRQAGSSTTKSSSGSNIFYFCDQIGTAEVTLKVVKPETAKNKETGIRISVPNDSLFAEKVCDTFEEGVDLCVEALLKQLNKYKEKQRKY